MKFGEAIEYNMGNIFLGKSYIKRGEKLLPNSFSKNQNWAYLRINSPIIQFVFIVCLSRGL